MLGGGAMASVWESGILQFGGPGFVTGMDRYPFGHPQLEELGGGMIHAPHVWGEVGSSLETVYEFFLRLGLVKHAHETGYGCA